MVQIVYKRTKELIPYVNNSRTHDEKQVNQIASSIKEFGFTNPLLIDEKGSIIAGHGRLMAANKLKMAEVPCIVLEGLTEAQKKAYVIADNKLALNAGWDEELLKLEIEGLKEVGFGIDILGFDSDELEKMLNLGFDYNENQFSDDFNLSDEDRSDIQQKTFTLHKNQIAIIESAINIVDQKNMETFGNTNKTGNSLYMVVKEWVERKK